MAWACMVDRELYDCERIGACGQSDVANIIEQDSLTLIEKSGFAEYYDPITGAPCGGGQFTWTAAMVIEFIKQSKAVA